MVRVGLGCHGQVTGMTRDNATRFDSGSILVQVLPLGGPVTSHCGGRRPATDSDCLELRNLEMTPSDIELNRCILLMSFRF